MKNFFSSLAVFLVTCALALHAFGPVQIPGSQIAFAQVQLEEDTISADPDSESADSSSGTSSESTSTTPPTPTSINVGDYLSAGTSQNTSPNFGALIVRVINFLAITIGSFAFLAIVIGGITMVTSAGRETQLQKGKDILKFAITGLIVALSSYFLTAFVQSIFYEYGR